MDSSTIIKFLAGLLPVAPITGELLDEELQVQQADSNEESNEADSKYADYKGPTMEEEIAAHGGNQPAIKGVQKKGDFKVQVGSRFNPRAGVYAVDGLRDAIPGLQPGVAAARFSGRSGQPR